MSNSSEIAPTWEREPFAGDLATLLRTTRIDLGLTLPAMEKRSIGLNPEKPDGPAISTQRLSQMERGDARFESISAGTVKILSAIYGIKNYVILDAYAVTTGLEPHPSMLSSLITESDLRVMSVDDVMLVAKVARSIAEKYKAK